MRVTLGTGARRISTRSQSDLLDRRRPDEAGATREVADEWIDRYPDGAAVMASIGRSGWNRLRYDGSIDDNELQAAVDESYLLVVRRLPTKDCPEGWDASSPHLRTLG